MHKEMTKTIQEEGVEEKDLAFANAQVVRVIRSNVSRDKIIKTEVKKAMNKFLEEMCADISRRMDQYPYATVDYRMFETAIEPYKNLAKITEEKKRLVAHLEVIKMDTEKMIRDVEETFITEK